MRKSVVTVNIATQAGGWDIKTTSTNHRCDMAMFSLDKSLKALKTRIRALVRESFRIAYTKDVSKHRIVWEVDQP